MCWRTLKMRWEKLKNGPWHKIAQLTEINLSASISFSKEGNNQDYWCYFPSQYPRQLTFWLLFIWCYRSHKILWGHKYFRLSMLIDDFQCGKVSKDFIWSRVSSDPVFIFHHLKRKILEVKSF